MKNATTKTTLSGDYSSSDISEIETWANNALKEALQHADSPEFSTFTHIRRNPYGRKRYTVSTHWEYATPNDS